MSKFESPIYGYYRYHHPTNPLYTYSGPLCLDSLSSIRRGVGIVETAFRAILELPNRVHPPRAKDKRYSRTLTAYRRSTHPLLTGHIHRESYFKKISNGTISSQYQYVHIG
jgi:hypothetical protein